MPSLTPIVKKILLLWISLWVLELVLEPSGWLPIREWFALRPRLLFSGDALGFLGALTYPLVFTGHLFHILLTGYMFALFGSMTEALLPPRRFLLLLISASLLGLLVRLCIVAIQPHFIDTPVLGGSGWVMAALAFAATRHPRMQLSLWVATIPLRTFFVIFLLIDAVQFLFLLGGKAVSTAVDIHLAGALAGFLVARPHYLSALNLRKRVQTLVQAPKSEAQSQKDDLELDRILAKIHEHGMPSLTASERRFLHRRSKSPKE